MQVAPKLNVAAQEADLVVLEGMGRGIETNLNAEFTCDALNLGMVKHPEVRPLPSQFENQQTLGGQYVSNAAETAIARVLQ